jgi:hypothetical protein
MRALDDPIERAAGSRPVSYRARSGGYSTADRYSVTLEDGRRLFVKSSDEPNLAGWLRREHEVYENLAGTFMPRLQGWDDDGGRVVLLLEDLSDADWTPRWDEARVNAVRAALAELAACTAPPNTLGVREVHPIPGSSGAGTRSRAIRRRCLAPGFGRVPGSTAGCRL